MKKIKIWEDIVQIVYIIIAQLGLLFSVTKTFGISYHAETIYFGVILLSILLFILLKWKRYGVLLAGAGIGLSEGLLFLWKKRILLKEIKRIIKMIETHMQSYVKNREIIHLYEKEKFTIGLLFFLILTIGIIAYVIVCTKRNFGIMAISLITFSIPFMAGEEPDAKTLICIGTVLVTAGFSKIKGIREKDRIIVRRLGIGIGILAVGFGGLFFKPMVKESLVYAKQYQNKIVTFWDKKKSDLFLNEKGVTGVNGGKLGEVGTLEQDNRTHLKVTVGKKPTTRVYLQGFIGENYTGHAWEEISGYEDTGMIYSMLSGKEEAQSEIDTMEIEYMDVNKKYTYQPYGSSLYAGSHKTIGEKQTMEYYPYEFLETNPAAEEWKKIEDIYGDDFNNRYTLVETDVKDNFLGQVENFVRGTDTDTIVKEVALLLDKQTDYSLHPGKTPQDRDFAEYFYFENRKGYCTHYATTATLFFRLKGIPSRYVSGYVIEPDEFVKKKDGSYEATVTGRNAHAWAEVYFSNGGYLPVETTPGYVKNDTPAEENAGLNLPSAQTNEVPKKEEEKKPIKQQDNQKKVKKEKRNMFPIVVGFGTGIVVLSGVAIICLVKKKKRKKIGVGYNEAIQELFHQIYRKLLRKKKITGKEELNQEFIEKLCSSSPFISVTEGEKMLDIVYRANYGRDKLKKEDYLVLKRIFLALEKEK